MTQPPSPPQPIPTITKPSRGRALIVSGIALVIALSLGGLGVTAVGNDSTDATAGTGPAAAATPASSAPPAAVPTTASATTAPTLPKYATPTKRDFTLKVKILRKQCFGTAGCNLTYRIDVAYRGAGDLDPDRTYEVTYQVKGAEDPIINTFEVTGDSASVQQEEMASTERSGDTLTAVVTDVAEF
ncbi:hypothetical protein [Micromonospora sp. NBRC 101691]|uniref:hypothetical protein n=1 Tax=Micromonospora sp. NBRC 101691 TaxID=3032198 RepID=UPI0024A1A234|nr:hypothetical protein [Micromonospora sp. NBRC 101691]GLY21626.1 hypothetical protein Misp04_13580 [Micromonospora sp. NBRC 101691]